MRAMIEEYILIKINSHQIVNCQIMIVNKVPDFTSIFVLNMLLIISAGVLTQLNFEQAMYVTPGPF